jgi:hypothetical protein
MAIYHVTCARRIRATDGTHEHVTHLCLDDGYGAPSTRRAPDVIEQLRDPRGDLFYVQLPDGRRSVLVEGTCAPCGDLPHPRPRLGGSLDEVLGLLPECRAGCAGADTRSDPRALVGRPGAGYLSAQPI